MIGLDFRRSPESSHCSFSEQRLVMGPVLWSAVRCRYKWRCLPVHYGGPQVHTKFKSLTPYSNHSRRIQIAHTKNQIFTPNSKILAPNSNHPHQKSNLHTEFKNTRTKFKSLTPKIKSSHRIQITHTEFKNTRTKFKSLTPNSNLHTEFKSLTPN